MTTHAYVTAYQSAIDPERLFRTRDEARSSDVDLAINLLDLGDMPPLDSVEANAIIFLAERIQELRNKELIDEYACKGAAEPASMAAE